MSWTIDDGLSLVRSLQGPAKGFGYHIALGGGVLNRGWSDKDIDLYFLPFNNTKYPKGDKTGLVLWLESIWGPSEPIGADYEGEVMLRIVDGKVEKVPPDFPSLYTARLKFIRDAGDRIDVFII